MYGKKLNISFKGTGRGIGIPMEDEDKVYFSWEDSHCGDTEYESTSSLSMKELFDALQDISTIENIKEKYTYEYENTQKKLTKSKEELKKVDEELNQKLDDLAKVLHTIDILERLK